MFLVGLTGGIACGKSLVSSLFRNLGVEVIDSDIIAREVVEPGKKAWKGIRKEFGETVFHPDGTLNRKALGHIIFNDPVKRRELNSIVHPEIYKSIFLKLFWLFIRGHQFVVIDLPLLYESGKMLKFMNKTIVVVCKSTQQLQRLMMRDKISEHEALTKINAQMPLKEKSKLADFIIYNDSSTDSTQRQVEVIVSELRKSRAHWKLRSIVIGISFLLCTCSCVLYYYFGQ